MDFLKITEKLFPGVSASSSGKLFMLHQLNNMAPVLGKRKRRDQITIDERNQPSAVDNESNLQALFQQHFESTFEPLPSSVVRSQIANNVDTQRSDEEVESDWDGFSDSGEEHAEVVQCAGSALSEADISRDEFKTFMVRTQIVIVHLY